jgi:chorismate mutase/prephenate dehydratase
MSHPQPLDDALAPFRQSIDELDRRIIDLLNERAKVVVEVGDIKRSRGRSAPIYAPDREREVLDKVRAYNQGPVPDSCLDAIWRELMSGSFALERPLRVGCLGPRGSFSHMAARKKFGASVEYDMLSDIAAVFEAIAREHIDYGLVPIENSAVGGIGETLDAFLDSPVQVCAEVLTIAHQNLLSNSPPDQIKKIYSKPVALSQCRKWLSVQMADVEKVATPSTSKAAEQAAGEEGAAAVASSLAGEIYGLKIQFANIEDNPNNTTRFFIIGHQSSKPTGDDKTSLMFTTEHKAGALTAVLDVFRDHDLNLTHIDKRPSQRAHWEYYFFIDVVGHIDDANLQQAVATAKTHCLHLGVLGSFPRARDVL